MFSAGTRCVQTIEMHFGFVDNSDTPLPVVRGVCIMEYPFGTMSVITLESLEDLNYVSDIAIILSWLSSMWSAVASVLFCSSTIEHYRNIPVGLDRILC